MKLSHKGLILISLPLACEILLVTILFGMLSQSTVMGEKARSARAVLSATHQLVAQLLEQSRAVLLIQMTDSDFAVSSFENAREKSLKCLAVVEQASSVNESSHRNFLELKKTADLLMSYLDDGKRLAESGQDAEATMQVREAQSTFEDFGMRLDRLCEPFKSQDAGASLDQGRALEMVKAGLLVGVAVSVALAGALVVYFNAGTTQRLKVLMENITRFGTGRPLSNPLSGSDEIAAIDDTFHTMARVIDEQNEQLKATEAELRSVLEGMPVGVAVLNPELAIEFTNPRADELLQAAGSDEREYEGQQLPALLIDERGQTLKVDDMTADGLKSRGQLFLRSGSGEPKPVEVTLEAHRGPRGRQLIASIVDVGERYQLEQAKREFVQMVSHDLRTPLNSVQLCLEMVVQGMYGELSEQGCVQLKVAEENCVRLIHLVNDLLDIDKLRSGQLDLFMTPCQVPALFESAIGSVQNFASRHGIDVKIGEVKVDEVYVDSGRLVQVLVNLISNAVKFSEAGTTITLRAITRDRVCRIEVRDQGRGIPADKLDAVFDRFVQVRKEDSHGRKGTGLGLAICRAIVEAHGGSIGVESQVGVGSTFWIDLPLDEEIEIGE